MKLVIVESPAKAKTINKYLGKGYEVLASFGHVRDLPAKDGSVRPDEDFAMSWEVDAASRKRLSDIASSLKGADELILATDPDREGEAISWHVLDVLRQKKALKDQPVRRVVFNAITKDAVTQAMKNPRDIDTPLVDAYLARRALDYLVGFSLSPVLWRKLPGSRSAGRVQSVTLRLVCDRESEIERFRPVEYWSVIAKLSASGKAFESRLYAVDGKVADRLEVKTGDEAQALKRAIDAGRLRVMSVEKKPTKRNPWAPFTTSSLQQEASSRLGLSPSRTMQIAQRLYEDGIITYMRTDGVQMAPEAIAEARRAVEKDFGTAYLPATPRIYQSRAKNAQEAHEAIRPTDMFRRPESAGLDTEQTKLYGLIWRRTLASQMRPAEIERTTADILVEGNPRDITLRAVGSVVTFPGFLALYGVQAKEDREDGEEDEDSRELPVLNVDDRPALEQVDIEQHFTQPPPRYTEASLIKKMEEIGIGRPSTYSATLATLKDRDYVRLEKRALIPEDRGRLVVAFLESFFTRYVEYGFTADLEEKLDRISAGELSWKEVLREFWQEFTKALDETKDLRVSEVLDALNDLLADHIFPAKPDGSDPRRCPTCGTGTLSLKIGKFGAFIGCSNYPECRHTMQLSDAATGNEAPAGDIDLGTDPDSGLSVLLKTGRFGPYVQLGDGAEPKRSSLPRGWEPASLTLEQARKLLALPREVGLHPETGLPITAGIGRYGPFVLHDGKYANLPDVEEVWQVGINRAVDLIAQKAAGGFRRNATTGARAAIKTFEHADGEIKVLEGRYGPYVNQGKVNATLPKEMKPEDVTIERALELIAAKGGASGGKKKAAAKKAAAKKPAAKKPAAKKPAAKKTAAKKAAAKEVPAA